MKMELTEPMNEFIAFSTQKTIGTACAFERNGIHPATITHIYGRERFGFERR